MDAKLGDEEEGKDGVGMLKKIGARVEFNTFKLE